MILEECEVEVEVGYISAQSWPDIEKRSVEVLCKRFAAIEPEAVFRRDAYILFGIVFPTSWMPRTVARIEPEVDVRTREAGVFGVED